MVNEDIIMSEEEYANNRVEIMDEFRRRGGKAARKTIIGMVAGIVLGASVLGLYPLPNKDANRNYQEINQTISILEDSKSKVNPSLPFSDLEINRDYMKAMGLSPERIASLDEALGKANSIKQEIENSPEWKNYNSHFGIKSGLAGLGLLIAAGFVFYGIYRDVKLGKEKDEKLSKLEEELQGGSE